MYVPRKVLLALPRNCDKNSSRYAFGGVKLERVGKGPKATAIACDGTKLVAIQFCELPIGQSRPIASVDPSYVNDYQVILQADTCVLAARTLAPKGKRIIPMQEYVLVDEKNTTDKAVPIGATNIESESVLRPQPLDGKYPQWTQVIPRYNADNSQSIVVNAKKLIEVLQSMIEVGAVRDDVNCNNNVTLTIAKDVYATDEETGEKIISDSGSTHPMLITGVSCDKATRGMGAIMPVGDEINAKRHRDGLPPLPILPVVNVDDAWENPTEETEPVVEKPETEEPETEEPELDESHSRCEKCGAVVNRVFLAEKNGKKVCPAC